MGALASRRFVRICRNLADLSWFEPREETFSSPKQNNTSFGRGLHARQRGLFKADLSKFVPKAATVRSPISSVGWVPTRAHTIIRCNRKSRCGVQMTILE